MLVMGDCHESIGYRLSVIGRRLLWADVMSVVGARAVGDCQSGIKKPAVGLLMVVQRPLREPQLATGRWGGALLTA